MTATAASTKQDSLLLLLLRPQQHISVRELVTDMVRASEMILCMLKTADGVGKQEVM